MERGKAERQRRPQVREEPRQPIAGDEALVDDDPTRARYHGEVAQRRTARSGLADDPPPGKQEPALEVRVADGTGAVSPSRPGDENLAKAGVRGERGGPEDRWVRRDPAPRGGRQPDLGQGRLDDRHGAPARRSPAGQEQLEDRRSLADLPAPPDTGRQPCEQRRLERQGHARPVRRGPVGAERASVPERREPGQGERHDPLGRSAAGIGDEADATRIVLERRVVQRWRMLDPAAHWRTPPSAGMGKRRPGRRPRGALRIEDQTW